MKVVIPYPHLMKKTALTMIAVFTLVGVVFLRSDMFCKAVQASCSSPVTTGGSGTQIAPSYFIYSDHLLSQALEEKKKVVLYFHAPWCTTCSSFDDELTKNFAELPSDTVVFRIDYDSASQLKQRYGVTYQHTLVLLDKNGNTMEMWIGGDLASLLQYLKQ